MEHKDAHNPDGIRLQKVLAQAGFGSRRVCEMMISDGRVSVDGSPVSDLGTRVDPDNVVLHVDGMRVQLDPTVVTVALNKPAKVVSAMSDPQGRTTLADFVSDIDSRLFHVGRLDYETEGLIFLTNDGELAHRLTHPSYEIAKTYVIEVDGPVPKSADAQLRQGVDLEDGPAAADKLRRLGESEGRVIFEMVIHQGRNRIVRRMFSSVGFPVQRLVRTRIGPITLGQTAPGKLRVLGRDELGRLMAAVQL